MKETWLVVIESKSPNNFGVNFMRSIISSVVEMMNGYKKAYSAKMTKVDNIKK